MMESKALKRPALGRGLGALIPGGSPSERKGVMNLGIEEIRPDRSQPRRHFDEAHIEELAESIRSKGVLLPLIVRRDSEGYVLVAGERRWRAAQKAGLRELPVMVREVSGNEAFEIALIENIQREDLNPIEEAGAYKRLKSKRQPQRKRDGHGGAQLRHLVEKLQRKLSVKVRLKDKGGSGTLEIRYGSLAELDRVLAAILGE